MRDGVVLRADVYRPAGEGAHPVLLHRTAYNKGAIGAPLVPANGPVQLDPVRAASNGYAVVIQDERGRYASDGEFRVFLDAADDGFDTVEWAGTQPWSNGKVGLYGMSYTGVVTWLAAAAAPAHLVCVSPAMAASDPFSNWSYRRGVLELAFCKSWALTFLSFGSAERLDGEAFEAALGRLVGGVGDMAAVFGRLPVADFPEVEGLFPSYDEWLEHRTYDEFWRDLDLEALHERITVPVHHMTGWYDVFLNGALRNYGGLRENGGSEDSRRRQKLLIGPWIHWVPPFPTRSGDVEFGAAAGVDWDAVQLRWFDHWLKGVDDGLLEEPAVKAFVMGANEWREADDWPLPETAWTEYYLHSDGCANGLEGCGWLSPEPPAEEPADRYLYDPLDPTPSRGGCLCCWPVDTPGGAFDQRPVEARRDVLVYTSAELAEPLEAIGPVRAVLFAATDAVDTDFTAKLVDVHPDGFAQNLCEGVVRARFRESASEPRLLEPGEVVRYEIDLWATGNRFLAGHKIRLEIASASFPKWDRNFNVATEPALATTGVVARQTVFHDAARASHVVLPVIPG